MDGPRRADESFVFHDREVAADPAFVNAKASADGFGVERPLAQGVEDSFFRIRGHARGWRGPIKRILVT
jgi:hypothetical protein